VKNVQVGGCLAESNGFGFDIGFSSGGGSESIFLDRNIATNNAIGFYIDGLQNTLNSNKADSNITAGFVVDGERHIASGNTANKQKYGFSIAGASHRLTSNSATNSFGESDSAGFSVNGVGSLFTANITENNLYGFDVYGENHIFRNNRVANNQIRGFEIRGKGHSIRLNAIRNNFEAGINIPDADNASLDITTNNIFGNGNEEYGQYCGIINEDTGAGVTVLAPNNYWGSASGPDLGPLPVNGVCGNVNPNPFATVAFNLRSGRFIP
jgi:parallel beta-helix repeat protein